MVSALIGIGAILMILGVVLDLADDNHQEVPCSEYADTYIKDVPVRCLSYFAVER